MLKSVFQKIVNADKKSYCMFTVFLSGLIIQVCLRYWYREFALEGIYFSYSSETLMHTVPIEDLFSAPLITLLNIHIQPPVYDAIRAAIVQFLPADMLPLDKVYYLDAVLYVLWAILYALTGTLMFLWLSQIISTGISFLASILFLLHPASIMFSQLLDSTLLSSYLILLTCYYLWKLEEDKKFSILPLTICFLLLYFTRSLFQAPALLVFTASLLLFRINKYKIVMFVVISATVIGMYTYKQFFKFGLLSTSSFVGLNLNSSIGNNLIKEYFAYLNEKQTDAQPDLPEVLTRKYKCNGMPNFNHISYIELNRNLMLEYKDLFSRMRMKDLIPIYYKNLKLYFLPSSTLHETKGWVDADPVISRLPWRGLWDSVFSFPVLPILLGISFALMATKMKRCDFMSYLGWFLPCFFIFSTTVLFEQGDNMRYKFFLEPVFIVFLAAQLFKKRGNVLKNQSSV